jgi:hypothetical protein
LSDPQPEPDVAELGVPVVEVEDLEVNFKGRVGFFAGLLGRKGSDAKAVDGVSVTLHEGEVLALAVRLREDDAGSSCSSPAKRSVPRKPLPKGGSLRDTAGQRCSRTPRGSSNPPDHLRDRR